MTEDAVDVAVIGAGPAGTCAAIAARAAGARVTIVERSTFPRTKVCGCCLSPAGVAVLRRLGAEAAIRDALPLHDVILECSGAQARIRGDRGVAIGRDALDPALLQCAAARGVQVRMGCSATIDGPGRVLVGPREDGVRTVLEASVVVVADGLAGTALGGHASAAWRWTVAPRSRMGFGAVLPAATLRCPVGSILMRVQHGGYIGTVRLPDGRVDVAAAADPAVVRRFGGPAGCALAWLGESVVDRAAVADAPWRGTPTLTRRRATVSGEGVMVVGDAAGYVEPFTGEGMGWAMRSGAAAGTLAAEVARHAASTAAWPRLLRDITHRDRLRCRGIAIALRNPALVGGAIRASRIAPWILDAFARRIGRIAAEHG